MKQKFTFLIAAAVMLLAILLQPVRLWGQTKTGETEEVYKQTIFSSSNNSQKINSYENEWYNTTNGFRVNIVNANNNNNGWGGHIRMGSKSKALTGTLITNAAIDQAITSVDLVINAITTSKITSISLYTSTDGSTWGDAVGTFAKATGTKTVTLSSPTANLYYKIEVVCGTGGSSNGFIEISQINFNAVTPSCSVSPTSWDFGEVVAGTTIATKTFTVTTANLSSNLSLTASTGYSVSQNSISSSETSTNVTVTCTPTIVGTQNGTLTIAGGGLTSNVVVNLTATGTCVTNNLAYPSTNIELTMESPEITLVPTTSTGNGGDITYEITSGDTSIAEIDEDTGYFFATNPGTWGVTATQEANGIYCEKSIEITITVVGDDPTCTISPAAGHNFGTILTNTSESFDFSVSFANLEHALTLSVPTGYSVTPSSIAANATSPVDVTVTFTPTAATAYNGNLTISGDDFGSDITADLSGTGDAGYTVTFNAWSGSCATSSLRVIQGTSIATLPTASPSATCTEDGWTFHGWATAKIDETTIAPTVYTSDYTVNSDHTLHAVYKITEGDNSNTGNVFSSGSYSNGEITWTSTGIVTIRQELYNGNTAPNSNYVSAPRWYSGNKITITQTTALDSIIVVANTSGYATALANSTYTNASASVCAWDNTGCTVKITPSSSSNITIVMGGQSRLSSLTAYYSNSSTTYNSNPLCLEKVETPNITLAEGTYTSVQTTTITCETDGATIYYTTNGDEPTTASTQYVANSNISINESMTIKAIAVADGMANSDVASKDYVINLPLTTMNAVFAKATQIGSSTTQDVTVVFNNWVVSAVNGSSAYVTDNAGEGFIIYTSEHGFAVGDKLSGTVSDTPLKLYNGAAEFTNIKKTDISSVTGEQTVAVVTKTISELSGVNTGAIITVNNVRYDGSIYLEDPDDSSVKIKPYNGLGYSASFTADHNYNVTGMYLQFNTTKELCPRATADIVEVEYAINGLGAVTNGTIGAQNSSSQNIITAKYGQSVTLTQSAAEGYRFSSWSVTNDETSDAITVTYNAFTMPKSSVTVSATFVPTYTITIASGIEHGTVELATPSATPAAAGDNIALTVTPNPGYALKSLTVYKTGDTGTTVEVSNKTFTMPDYPVTVTAEFDAEYTVTYYRNAVNDDETAELTYGEGADVTILAYDDNAVDFEAPEGKKFVKWTANSDGTGTAYQPDVVIEDIAANYDLYAQWRDIVYHVSFSVNGEIVSERNVDYNTAIGTLPEDPELAPLTFLGWSSTSATGATNVTASWKPTGENEDVTVYAVFGSMSSTSLTITGATTGIPTGYGSGNWTIDSKAFYQSNILYQNPSQNKVIQFRAPNNNGYIYNKTDFGNIRSVKITYYSGSAEEKLVVYAGDTEHPTSATDVSSSGLSSHVETFTISGNHKYICIYNTYGTDQVAEIRINYEAAAPLTVNIIDANADMTDIEATTCVVVTNGATLNFTGENKGNANNLIIKDGGQLKVYATDTKDGEVQATVEKNITHYTVIQNHDEYLTDGWYFIASPINSNALAPTNVTNMLSNTYDLYQLNNTSWENYKEHAGNANPGFNLANGRGYLYANSEDVTLSFAGAIKPFNKETPTANQVAVKTGWNLIGNPFTFNVYADVPYYAMNAEGTGITANTVATSTAIAPCTSIVIKAENASTVNFSETSPVLSTGDHGNLQMVLAHKVATRDGASVNKNIDNAIVSFNEGSQLEKFYFGNPSASIFIPQNGEDYAIAFSDRQGDVPLYFKANETGTYTISFAGDEMSLNGIYLIDILAEEEIDLSVNPSYTFIGSPADRMARFKIVFRNTNGDGTSDIFAYQNGNDIIVSGEGELQIFDVMGRMVSRQYVSGVEAINILTQGVYIMKLNDKTQKIVVR